MSLADVAKALDEAIDFGDEGPSCFKVHGISRMKLPEEAGDDPHIAQMCRGKSHSTYYYLHNK